jgi:uncharacterized damage-inducible protein DinB
MVQASIQAPGALDNQELLDRLRRSRDRYLEVVTAIPEDLCRIRPAEGAWSVLECAEHVTLAEKGMFAALEKRCPTDAAADLTKDALINAMLLDRTRKATAPERSRPTGNFATLAEALAQFTSARERTLAFVEQTSEDLRKCTVMHPLGVFDGCQVLLIMSLHPQRHALQIEEIKNSPAYRAGLKK